jgi:hypothetical protein
MVYLNLDLVIKEILHLLKESLAPIISNHFSREAQLTQSTFESSSSLDFSACSPASIGDVGEYGVTAGPDQEA